MVPASSQLFVGRLPRDVQATELEQIFEKFGKMSRCDVKRGMNLCYAFIEYSSSEDAADAMKECDGMTIQGERIVVEFAKNAAKRRDNNGCFRCGEEGHWAKDCPSGGQRRGGGRSPRRSYSRSPSRTRRHHHRGDRRDDRYDRRRQGSRSPPRRDHHRGSQRRPSSRSRRHHHSRSRSPPPQRNGRQRSRSPGMRKDLPNDRDRGRNDGWAKRSPDSALGAEAAGNGAPEAAGGGADNAGNSWGA